jgi:hypothetical protein
MALPLCLRHHYIPIGLIDAQISIETSLSFLPMQKPTQACVGKSPIHFSLNAKIFI